MSYDIPSDPEEELPDWLKGMQSEEDRADHERDDFLPDEGGEDKPDWLETQPFKSEPSPIQGDDEEEVPDWLASIRESESALKQEIEEIPESKEADGDEPDWLINLREQQAEEMGDQVQDEETGVGGDLISRIQSLQEASLCRNEVIAEYISFFRLLLSLAVELLSEQTQLLVSLFIIHGYCRPKAT
jgi:hypothetical protein